MRHGTRSGYLQGCREECCLAVGRAAQREYYRANREACLEYARKYYEATKSPKPLSWPELPNICAYCTGPVEGAKKTYCSSVCRGKDRSLRGLRLCSRCRTPWRPMSRHRHTTRSECWNCHIDTMTRTDRPNPWNGLKGYRKKQLLKRAGGLCEDCGGTDHLEAHHIVPRALGGAHDLENLKLLCWDCHQGSGWMRNHATLVEAGLAIPPPDTQLAFAA